MNSELHIKLYSSFVLLSAGYHSLLRQSPLQQTPPAVVLRHHNGSFRLSVAVNMINMYSFQQILGRKNLRGETARLIGSF